MDGGDGGHQREAPGRAALQGIAHEGDPLIDGSLVPPGAVLISQEHQLANVSEARVAPGIGQKDQGQKARDVGIVGEQRTQHAGQVEGSLHEVPTEQVCADGRGMPGRVEDVHHRENGIDA